MLRDYRGMCCFRPWKRMRSRWKRICRRRSIGRSCRLCSSLCDVGPVVSITEKRKKRKKYTRVMAGIFLEAERGCEGRGCEGREAYATNEPPMLLQSSVLYVFIQE